MPASASTAAFYRGFEDRFEMIEILRQLIEAEILRNSSHSPCFRPVARTRREAFLARGLPCNRRIRRESAGTGQGA